MGTSIMNKNNIIYNVSDLIIAITAETDLNKSAMIGIDGVAGCGKSKIAEQLSKEIGAKWIEVDEYLDKHKGGYIPFIKYDQLEGDIKKERKQNQPIIVEGICLLEVLDHIKEKPDIFIYVKRVLRKYGTESWYDDYLCDPNSDLYRKVEDSLEKEIQKYYEEFRPTERTNYFYHQDNDQLNQWILKSE